MNRFNAWLESVATAIGLQPELLALMVLLMAGLAGHLLLGHLIRRLHRAAGSNRNKWDDVVVTALERPVRLVLWVLVGYIALDTYEVGANLQARLIEVYDTALVLLVVWFLHRLIGGVENELMRERYGNSQSTDKATVRAVIQLSRICLWVIAGLGVLQSIGVSISGLLAFGGIGGIAVGFAAKDLLANFIGGLSIYLDRPFTTGDWIRSPDRNIEGTVEDIGWRLTRIRTFDQRPLYVPNAVFGQISVENPSRMFNRRIYETVGIRYQDSQSMAPIVEQVRAMLQSHQEIDLSRTLIVNFVSFGPSSLDFFVYTFTKTTDWVRFHEIKQDVMLKILDIVISNGADVAFPTQTLHVEQVMQMDPEHGA
ncbi:mechanosensitive ion channel family protein [Halieaceae bacterium IMCC8485]|uniref:Mechanosensitive ion channel family protein n=1 Tax=Candidatus Seongchinamella marina TaxID=2518990 RepID=A0ABT3STZ4_9GAMM|nr:mechanosensitive ion channel family protein [Candidatus Seongchinamella marina]MCX2973461.1 mechanosensitive ion channel family protein [Candidatus Seongchinamella marina]